MSRVCSCTRRRGASAGPAAVTEEHEAERKLFVLRRRQTLFAPWLRNPSSSGHQRDLLSRGGRPASGGSSVSRSNSRSGRANEVRLSRSMAAAVGDIRTRRSAPVRVGAGAPRAAWATPRRGAAQSGCGFTAYVIATRSRTRTEKRVAGARSRTATRGFLTLHTRAMGAR
jgi:hypothetical protein